MVLLHRGFDTLTLAIKAHIPQDLFDTLEAEKARADEENRPIVLTYNGMTFHLKPHGGAGYRFLLEGGPEGARWAFKKPHAKDPWGVRVTFGSDFMAMRGLGAAKASLERACEKFGIRYGEADISISRVDFCADILAPDFQLIPDQFVMHSNARRRDFLTDEGKSVYGRSGRVTSCTVGAVANRQAIIYDKREEIIAKGKPQWWAIWNHTLANARAPNVTLHRGQTALPSSLPSYLDPNDPDARVWRVELRAGKSLLKDRWNIRTWADLFARYGDLCREAGEVIRYTDPAPGDTNRARWPNHPLWEIAMAEINDDLGEMRSGVDPNPLKEVHREQHIGLLAKNILGTTIALAALHGKTMENLPAFLTRHTQDMQDQIKANPTKTARQLHEATERYVFLKPPERPM